MLVLDFAIINNQTYFLPFNCIKLLQPFYCVQQTTRTGFLMFKSIRLILGWISPDAVVVLSLVRIRSYCILELVILIILELLHGGLR